MRLRFALGALLAFAGHAAAGEAAAVATLAWEPGYFGKYRLRAYALEPTPPEGVTAPAGANRFVTIPLGPKHGAMFAFDAAGEQCWADRDLDGELTDEKPEKCERGEGTTTLSFPAPGLDAPLPVPVYYKLDAREVHVATRVHRRGVVELAGRIRAVVLVDGDGNLRFDDPERDRLYVDVDGENDIALKEPNHERIQPGKPFRLRRSGYVARVLDPLGERVEFKETKPVPPPVRWYFQTVREPAHLTRRDTTITLDACKRLFRGGKEADQIRALEDAAHIGSKASVRFLLDTVDEAKRQNVQRTAAEMLGYAPAKYAPDVARLALEHRSVNIRWRAVIALHRMDAPKRDRTYAALLKDFPKSNSRDLYETTARYLAYGGTDANRKILTKAFKGQKSYTLRDALYNSATHYDPDGAPAMIMLAALKDPDPRLQAAGLWDLWAHRHPRAPAEAMRVLKRKDLKYLLESTALRVLASDGDGPSVRAVLSRVAVSPGVRENIRDLLRPVRDPGGVAEMVKGLQHRDEATRKMCADMLAGIRRPEVTDALLAALKKEKKPDVQAALAEAVGDHGDPRGVDILLVLAQRGSERALAPLGRLGGSRDDVRAVFAKRLRAARWQDRVLALGVVGAQDLSGVVANLVHKEWSVRLAAIGALRRLRVKDGIPPLIERLAVETRVRLRFAIGETLFALTGKNIGVVGDAWRAWWTAGGADFTVPAAEPKPDAGKGRTVAGFYGLPVHSDRVCFVVDASDSMTTPGPDGIARLTTAVAEVKQAVGRLADTALVSVIVFDTNVRSWRKRPTALSAANRKNLVEFLDAVKAQAATNVHGALMAALKHGVDTVFVLSDGAPSAGLIQDPVEIARAVRRHNQTRLVTIHTIAIGRESGLLKRLAGAHLGTYVRR